MGKALADRFSRIGMIAGITLTGAVRQRMVLLVGILGAGLIGGAHYLWEFDFGSAEQKFLMDLGFGTVGMFGTLLAIVATAQSWWDELDGKTAQITLARPVTRVEFVLGKLVGLAGLLGFFAAVMTTILMLVLWWRAGPRDAMETLILGWTSVPYGAISVCGFLQWVRLCVVAAMTLFIASYAGSALFTIVLGVMFAVIGHLQFLLHEPGDGGDGGIGQAAAILIGLVFPNFRLFDLGGIIAGDGQLTPELTMGVAGYGGLYVAVYAALAACSFSRRDL
ncbi:MAG: ABC transporter permease subunit [Opitutaceae bacterium]|nr:ABC transporter permease subunit [Opitutaceae bacterium]